MNNWYAPFVAGIVVFLLIFTIKNNLYQSISIGIGMFLAYFIIYLIIKYKENNEKNKQ